MMIVMASGSGSNFEALAQAFPGEISCLICNVEGAGAFERARRLGIPSHLISQSNFKSRSEHESAVMETISQWPQTRLLVLAGWMRILGPTFFERWKLLMPHMKAINLHPSHLDDYKGPHAYAFAVLQKYPRWGLSVHELTPSLDSGLLLGTTELPVFPWDEPETLAKRAQPYEHTLLVETVGRLLRT